MRLPINVQEIADVIGRERALYLVGQLPRCVMRDKRFPGTFKSEVLLYVPKRLPVDHELVHILGLEDAQKLARHFGGEILKPGTCAEVYRRFRDASIRDLHRQGLNRGVLAEWFDMSERQVRNVLNGAVEITQEVQPAANDEHPANQQTRDEGCSKRRRM